MPTKSCSATIHIPKTFKNWAQSYQQKNSQNSENFLRFSKRVCIKIFWGKFTEICPASCTKIFYLKISQIFWKNWRVQNFQILSENLSELRFLLIGLSPGLFRVKYSKVTTKQGCKHINSVLWHWGPRHSGKQRRSIKLPNTFSKFFKLHKRVCKIPYPYVC